jgi:hypothetical protein
MKEAMERANAARDDRFGRVVDIRNERELISTSSWGLVGLLNDLDSMTDLAFDLLGPKQESQVLFDTFLQDRFSAVPYYGPTPPGVSRHPI